MPKKIIKNSKNIQETEKIAGLFLKEILKAAKDSKNATIIGLSGELGAGKTAFTQGAAKHLGIRQKVSSPTFVIMKKYSLKSKNYKFFFHIDAYRLKNEQELLNLDWDKIAKAKEHIIFLEWPENVPKVLPARSRFVYITTDENGHRSLKLK